MIDLLMLLSLDTSKAERLHLQILICPMAMTISFAALPFRSFNQFIRIPLINGV